MDAGFFSNPPGVRIIFRECFSVELLNPIPAATVCCSRPPPVLSAVGVFVRVRLMG